MAGFTVAVSNGSTEPAYYVDRLHRQRVQLQHQQHCQQPSRFPAQPSHVPASGKEILEAPRRHDLVYVHCATTEDEDAEEEEEEPKRLTRSRSWLCCPGDHSSDKTVPIQVEANHKHQESVSPGHSILLLFGSCSWPNLRQEPLRNDLSSQCMQN